MRNLHNFRTLFFKKIWKIQEITLVFNCSVGGAFCYSLLYPASGIPTPAIKEHSKPNKHKIYFNINNKISKKMEDFIKQTLIQLLI